MILTIAIPTVEGREDNFNKLYDKCVAQSNGKSVEVIYLKDNKEISIGKKRNNLIALAKGEYIVMIDDDDDVADDYVDKMLKALETKPDCIGYVEKCISEGRIKYSIISRRFSEWKTYPGTILNRFHHVRSPFFKVPIKTDICRMVTVPDLRFGEDHEFAKLIYPLLKIEVFIDEVMYIYKYRQEEHNKKYGIK